MTLTGLNIDISGDPSEMLCTQEEAISWFSSLKGEYENSVSKLGNCSLNIAFLTKVKIQEMNKIFAGNSLTVVTKISYILCSKKLIILKTM